MNFETIDNGALLKLNEKFNIDIEENYIYIGFTGEGDILALENDTGSVVCINHENLEKMYINNTVSQLAESLLEYEKFIQEINTNNGEFAYVDKEWSLEELNDIKEKLISIDIKSLQKNSFWSNELSLFNNLETVDVEKPDFSAISFIVTMITSVNFLFITIL